MYKYIYFILILKVDTQGSDPWTVPIEICVLEQNRHRTKKGKQFCQKIHFMRNILLKLLTSPSQPCVKQQAYHGNCSEKLMIHDNTLRGLDPCGPFTLLSFRREPHFLKMQILDTGVNFASGWQGTKEGEKGSEVLIWRTSSSLILFYSSTLPLPSLHLRHFYFSTRPTLLAILTSMFCLYCIQSG